MFFKNVIPVFLAGLVGLSAAAPAPNPAAAPSRLSRLLHPNKAMDEIIRFNAKVDSIALAGNKVIKQFQTREPLETDKQPIYEFMYQILQDRAKVREFRFDLRTAVEAEENYFTVTYTDPLTESEQRQRMMAMDKAEQELAAWKSFLGTSLERRLTPDMFDNEVKEYMSEQKTAEGQKDRLAAFGKNHKRTLTAKKNLWKEMTLAQQQMDDGMKIADGLWIEEQRLQAYEREANRQRTKGLGLKRVDSIVIDDADLASE